MKMLSIRQPWASLIASGAKGIENRSWPTRYRGPILIHASQRADNITSEEIEQRCDVRPPAVLPVGGVVGVAVTSPVSGGNSLANTVLSRP